MIAVGLGIATVVPFLFLLIIHRLDFYKMGQPWMVAISMVWGMATGMLLIAPHTFLASQTDPYVIVRYIVPVTEELVKAVILIVLMRHPQFRYFVNGAIYGFGVGIGFAVFENGYTLLNSPEQVILMRAVRRVISVNLMHGSASAIVGIALGKARFEQFPRRWMYAAGGMMIAIILHALYNNLVTRVAYHLLVGTLTGVIGGVVIGLIIRQGLAQEKRQIDHSLKGDALVTKRERDLVGKLNEFQPVLAILSSHFDDHTTRYALRLLYHQAQYGFMQWEIKNLPDGATRQGVQQRIQQVAGEIEQLRRELGSYTMLYLRTIFPEKTSPLWDLLATRIEAQRSLEPTGPTVYDRLAQVLLDNQSDV